MSSLQNFPFKNQLDEPLLDGIPNINALENCFPTSLAAGMHYLLQKEYTGEEIEHAVYGRDYRGGTAAISYVPWASDQGVKLHAISSADTRYLVQQCHVHLALGHPVICTISSSYAPPADPGAPGKAHCVVFYEDTAGILVAMNPWRAVVQANADAWWASRMCYGQVWILERGHMSGIPQGWSDAEGTLTAPNGIGLQHSFRNWVMAHDWRSDDVPLGSEYRFNGGTRVDFLYEALTLNNTAGLQVRPYGQDYQQTMKKVLVLRNQVRMLQRIRHSEQEICG